MNTINIIHMYNYARTYLITRLLSCALVRVHLVVRAHELDTSLQHFIYLYVYTRRIYQLLNYILWVYSPCIKNNERQRFYFYRKLFVVSSHAQGFFLHKKEYLAPLLCITSSMYCAQSAIPLLFYGKLSSFVFPCRNLDTRVRFSL